jgi:L-rhamnose-H+ transport protein
MDPNPVLGVTLHSLGGLAAASFYIPYKGVRRWAWENFWLVGGVFSWIIAPWLLALILVPQTLDILRAIDCRTLAWTFLFGVLWGVGGLTFGLTMRYLGIALGYAIALGLCAACGTLIPPIFAGELGHKLSTTGGKVGMAGIALCMLGIAISGVAGMRKERELTDEQKRKTVSEFSFVKGLIVALICGVMSACMAFAIAAGGPIKSTTVAHGARPIWQGLPLLIVILAGGFLTNAVWCVILGVKNKTLTRYIDGASEGTSARAPIMMNLVLCAVAGVTWYLQFFFYTMGESQMGAMNYASWSLHMASIIIFSTLWGVALHEWRGTSAKTHVVMAVALAMLILSMIVIGRGTYLDTIK